MAEEKLLTVRDVSMLLGINEKEVLDLAENGTIPAYKVGGVYLRFKRDQVIEYKKTTKPPSAKPDTSTHYPVKDRFSDFFYYNDFYFLTVILIILLLVIIFWGF